MAVQETVLCSATKDPKHVLQDESLFEPCFLKQVMCFAGLYQSVMPQKRPREQLGISLVSSEIQIIYRMITGTRSMIAVCYGYKIISSF